MNVTCTFFNYIILDSIYIPNTWSQGLDYTSAAAVRNYPEKVTSMTLEHNSYTLIVCFVSQLYFVYEYTAPNLNYVSIYKNFWINQYFLDTIKAAPKQT